MKTYNVGVIGCGDYLRRQANLILASNRIRITQVFDLDRNRANAAAQLFGAAVADSAESVIEDRSIGIVLLFTPPWARKALVNCAVRNRKHIIMAKPLAAHLSDADVIRDTVGNRVSCAVFYRRSVNPVYQTMKTAFDSGQIGKLVLYKEDWLHHYPVWNSWATDRERNRGPFMDAMIHTLNIARYLIAGQIKGLTFFSDNYAGRVKCPDTEFLKLDFLPRASAHLFISWAADLAIYDRGGNDREFLIQSTMITDEGWYVSEVVQPQSNVNVVQARREDTVLEWPVPAVVESPYDGFVAAMESGEPQAYSLEDAWIDTYILEQAMQNANKVIDLPAFVPPPLDGQ